VRTGRLPVVSLDGSISNQALTVFGRQKYAFALDFRVHLLDGRAHPAYDTGTGADRAA